MSFIEQILVFMCWPRRKRYRHPSLLVGAVINGEPIAPFNRRVLTVSPTSCTVISGSMGAVKNGGGKIKDIKKIGRMIVPVEKHLSIVESWMEEALVGRSNRLTPEVILEIQRNIESNENPPEGTETMELDVFSAVIINSNQDCIFAYRDPSSFPY